MTSLWPVTLGQVTEKLKKLKKKKILKGIFGEKKLHWNEQPQSITNGAVPLPVTMEP